MTFSGRNHYLGERKGLALFQESLLVYRFVPGLYPSLESGSVGITFIRKFRCPTGRCMLFRSFARSFDVRQKTPSLLIILTNKSDDAKVWIWEFPAGGQS